VLSLTFVATGEGEVLLAGLHRHGVARSTDDGATWHLTNTGLDARLLTSLVLSPDFAHDRTLFVAGPQDGVSVSSDGGQTWADRADGLDSDPGVLALAVSPAFSEDHTVYVATAAGVYVSRDWADTWARSPEANEPARTVATSGGAGESVGATVLAALAGGRLLASDDRAATWRTCSVKDFEGAEIVLVALSPDYARDRTIFVATSSAQQGESAEVALWRSVDGGSRWDRWLVERDVGGPGVGAGNAQRYLALALSPSYPSDELVFAGLGARVLTPVRHARQVRTGERRPIWRAVDLGGGAVAVTAVAPSPSYAADRTVFAATNAGVFVSRDGGETFQPWSDGLVPPRVVALAVSPAYYDDRLVYGLGLGGIIWRRQDQAASL
jgi:hypothetical protein